MFTQEWLGQVVDEARKRQRAIRQTTEAIFDIGETSGAAAGDLLADVAVVAALKTSLTREEAIDMVNRAHNRVVAFLQTASWDGLERDFQFGR